ncbi:GDP-mannose 4,6-dehydratase [uncultured Imperialibacter sp.]|uniref:NAD-dependent epimerase/dehydratase family protein n=1 Tax=uncultured Imperialibacter sp. TaxID=1672639 RepID=UPI0030D88F58|tara:strand:+ start:24271 stop:25185 length:915 start_codon:yes stop_codon:yes gene_type:complete
MRVLVTGGAGFIGSAIVPLLEQEGHTVHVLDNLSFGNREFLDIPDSQFHLVDLRDAEAINQLVSRLMPEIVVHLAAIHFIPYCNAHPFESSDVNIRGTMNLFNALRQTKSVQRVFFASTAAVYPIYDHAVSETDATGPLDIYGLSKLTGEHLCKEYHLLTGVDTVVCRFFNAFGPNETNPHLIPEIEAQLKRGVRTIRLGNLEPKRDFIHTHDMANAVKALLEIPNLGYDTFNLGRGIEYAVTEVVEEFSGQIGEEISIEVDPDKVRKTDRMHLVANVNKLKEVTGWEPQWDLARGVKDLVENW